MTNAPVARQFGGAPDCIVSGTSIEVVRGCQPAAAGGARDTGHADPSLDSTFRHTGVRRALVLGAAIAFAFAVSGGSALASNASARRAVLNHYAALARREDPHFTHFSAAAGRAFFLAHPPAARRGTPSCSTCHMTDPRKEGRTPAGKWLLPMAVSRSPKRFTGVHYADRWFGRMCRQVYGRSCTPIEKGDFITFMINQ
jgi:mono/diheme cytochrome c family protein